MKTTLTQEIDIEYVKQGNDIICKNHHTVIYLWGSKISITDLCSRYNVKRLERGKYSIPIQVIKNRLGKVRNKKIMLDNAIKILESVLNNQEVQEITLP